MRLRAGLTFLLGVGLLGAGLSGAAVAQGAQTTRIETRPYYGAVVTIENGVRVYRPVPPTTHMIINPDGATPLAIQVGPGSWASQSGADTSGR
ncbi:MAG: hypothetical protein WC829_15555 [Hyphomicrobium sp.]|jgi:hypothetical protein